MSIPYHNSLGKRFLEVEHLEARGWLHVRWRGRLTTEDVLLGCEHILTALRQTRCPCLLNDNTEVTKTWPHANDWIAQQMVPQAVALGLRRLAHLLPPGGFGRPLAEDLQRRVASWFDMELFTDLADAQAWLRPGYWPTRTGALQRATG